MFYISIITIFVRKKASLSSKITYYQKQILDLKEQSCKLDNNKYMITLTKITNTEIFAYITFLIF